MNTTTSPEVKNGTPGISPAVPASVINLSDYDRQLAEHEKAIAEIRQRKEEERNRKVVEICVQVQALGFSSLSEFASAADHSLAPSRPHVSHNGKGKRLTPAERLSLFNAIDADTPYADAMKHFGVSSATFYRAKKDLAELKHKHRGQWRKVVLGEAEAAA